VIGNDTNFNRLNADYEHREPECIFRQRENGDEPLAFMFEGSFPVSVGHTLITPRLHVTDYFHLHQSEKNAIDRLMVLRKAELEAENPSISGFIIGVNVNQSAGQTVFHVHVHLIPRRDGDMSDPRGGVRGVIPERQKYDD
tara:strand:- start:2886 stop:3308 length:423 start_codon:yes stop_codon:yes gene_type:complete